MAVCGSCGFNYPDCGNGCWRCNPSLSDEFGGCNISQSSSSEWERMGMTECAYWEMQDFRVECINGKPQIYIQDGLYMHPKDADFM